MVLWNWALTCGIWILSYKILSESELASWHPVEPENCLLVWGRLHTHTLIGIWSGNPFSTNIRLVNEQEGCACECLKYFLCWFFKFPITTVPPLRFKHYLQRPKMKTPYWRERHHCFCISLEGRFINWFNLKEKQFNGRKECMEDERRPKLGVLPQDAKLDGLLVCSWVTRGQ